MGKQRKKSRSRQNRNRQRSDSVSWAGLSRQPQAGVRREGRRTVFATSFGGTLFMPLVMGLLLVFIALLVFLAVSGFLPTVHDWAAKAAAGVFLLYGLKRSEGWWFGLTCRRFASIGGGELVLYGAFGRTRFRCPTDWRFDYLCSVRCRIFSFRTISPDGHSRRFSTSLCRNTAALIAELGAVDRGREMSVAMQNGFMELFDNLDKRKRRGWRILIGLVSATVLLACVRQIFGNTLLSPLAWQVAAALTAAWLLPLAWMSRKVLVGETVFGLPSNHYLRQTAIGRIRVFLTTGGKTALFWLAIGALCVWSLASLSGAASLWGKPFERVAVEMTVEGSCGRYGRLRQLAVRLPKSHRDFDGSWCEGSFETPDGETVYVRRSLFARELRFSRP